MSETKLPERLGVADHGRNCGNAIRFELTTGYGADCLIIASLEDENEKQAGKMAEELCHRYNTHARLVEALENVVVSEFGSIKIAESWEKENKSDCYWHKAIAALRLARERK